MAPVGKQANKTAKAAKSPAKAKLTGTASPFKNASVEEKMSLWNENGGGLYGSEKAINDESSSHQDVVVTVLTDSDVTATKKKSVSKGPNKAVKTAKKKDDKPEDLLMSGALLSSETSSKSKEENDKPKLARQRSASLPNVVTVEPSTPNREKPIALPPPATVPARPPMMVRRKYKPDTKLEEELKRASAPPRRVISDGKWVRHRIKEPEVLSDPEPPKKSPTKPKPPKAADLKLGWIRPPMIARKDATELQPTPQLEMVMPQLPPIRTLRGKMKKPILHQFVPGTRSSKLNPGVAPGLAAQRAAQIAMLRKLAEDSSAGSDSDSDASSSSTSSSTSSDASDQKLAKSRLKAKQRKRRKPSVRPSTPSEAMSEDNAAQTTALSHRKAAKPRLRSKSEDHLGSFSLASRQISEQPARIEPRQRALSHDVRNGTRNANSSQDHRDDPLHKKSTPSGPAGQMSMPNKVSSWLTSTLDPFIDRFKSSKSKQNHTTTGEESGGLSPDQSSPVPALRQGRRNISPRPTRHRSMPLRDFKQDSTTRQNDRRVTDRLARKPDSVTDMTGSDYTDDASSAASTPRLKRSGARRAAQSPHKHRQGPSTLADTESSVSESLTATSYTGSSVTESSAVDSSRAANSDYHDPTKRDTMALAMKNKEFPSTGRRLSTIASVETLSTHIKRNASGATRTEGPPRSQRAVSMIVPALAAGTAALIASTTNEPRRPNESITVPRGDMKRADTMLSRRSTKSRGSKAAMSTTQLMSDLANDESFYMPELRTLVGGVIKVLFRAVLSKSDTAIAAGLFSRFGAEGAEKEATRIIHEMGVALERLKSYHNRIPKSDAPAFLVWALGAHRIYTEYVRTWRLGFQDVVVSLVPADDLSAVSGKDVEGSSMADALPRNADGYVVDSQGQMVDVAFLLKRPLIRLKGLTKTIRAMHVASPTAQSQELVAKYEQLMDAARHKVNAEKARIEDQMAAQIDVSRVRDPASLGALSGVKIDPNRCVRARDVFEMHMIHSSGQEIISKVEVLIRDNPSEQLAGGDVLLCQSDGHKRWLLLPPISLTHISARHGEIATDLVVMVRGVHSQGHPWQELLQLTGKDPHDIDEWVRMLGLSPRPPPFSREVLVVDKSHGKPQASPSSSIVSSARQTDSTVSRETASPESSGVNVPVGERNGPIAKPWVPRNSPRYHTRSPTGDFTNVGGGRSLPNTPRAAQTTPSPIRTKLSDQNGHSMARANDMQTSPTLKRSSARVGRPVKSPIMLKTYVESSGQVNTTPRRKTESDRQKTTSGYVHNDTRSVSGSSGFSVWMPSACEKLSDDSDEDKEPVMHFAGAGRSPPKHHRSTSMPIQRMSSYRQNRRSQERFDQDVRARDGATRSSPMVADRRNLYESNADRRILDEKDRDMAPAPPPHRIPVHKSKVSVGRVPDLKPDDQSRRRSSSPLKHSWQPESGSENMSDDNSESDSYDDIATSESEGEDDTLSRLEEYHATQSVLNGASSEVTDDITPSQSASQAPFRDVPASEEIYTTVLASVSTWNSSEYKPIHEHECLIEIGPGKISAFETITDPNALVGYQTRKRPHTKAVVALALTPHVLIQVLNVHDVLISSIPTWDSRFQPPQGQKMAKVRFHTRYQSHRQKMVEAIQLAMHNNPIYQRLERDRPKETAAEMFDRQNPGEAYRQEKQRSWFGGSRRGGSFRKSNTGAGSTVGNTEYSGRTTSSIRRGIQSFLDRTTNFNIDKSTIFRKSRDGHTSTRDRDLGSSAPRDLFARQYPMEMNQVVRSTHCSVVRYDMIPGGSRQARRLGKVTLHILHAPRGPLGAAHGIRGPDGIHSGDGHRLVIANESSIVLDRVLPPSCFVMDSRGIIVHVFDQKTDDGRVASTGGVGTWTTDLYCLTGFINETMRDWLFTTLSKPIVVPM